jgi:AcrR family transcriptional regulator
LVKGYALNVVGRGGLTLVSAGPSKRTLSKQRTRQKILQVAKTLFADRGYEGATIRDIAAAAGMSTGAVFANFADKGDLFAEIAAAEHEDLLETMRAAAQDRAPAQAVLAMLEAAAERHLGDLALFRVTTAANWAADGLIAAVLGDGSPAGRADWERDVGLIAQMLWDCYLATLTRASLGRLSATAVKRRLKEEVEVILAGARQA